MCVHIREGDRGIFYACASTSMRGSAFPRRGSDAVALAYVMSSGLCNAAKQKAPQPLIFGASGVYPRRLRSHT